VTFDGEITYGGALNTYGDDLLYLNGTFTVAWDAAKLVYTVGFTNVTGKLSAGGVELNLTIERGAFIIFGDLEEPGSGGAAGTARVTAASLSGVGGGNSFEFTLEEVDLNFNTTGDAQAASIDVAGTLVSFDFSDISQHDFIRIGGSLKLEVSSP